MTSSAMTNQDTIKPAPEARRPSIAALGGLDMAAVQARLQHEFAIRAQQDPHKNPLPSAEELQGDFDALIEARALKLLESRSRSGSFSASRRSSFNANHPREAHSPTDGSGSPSSDSPHPPLRAPHLHHLPSGLSMTSATPAHHSPLHSSVTPGTDDSKPILDSALSSGTNTPNTEPSRSRMGSRGPSRRPSVRHNPQSYEVR